MGQPQCAVRVERTTHVGQVQEYGQTVEVEMTVGHGVVADGRIEEVRVAAGVLAAMRVVERTTRANNFIVLVRLWFAVIWL